jgi:energy-coupling factor transporter transmembrane protein EcfT
MKTSPRTLRIIGMLLLFAVCYITWNFGVYVGIAFVGWESDITLWSVPMRNVWVLFGWIVGIIPGILGAACVAAASDDLP